MIHAVDPVCGMEMENPQIKSSHDGDDYYFCSIDCKDEFDADPLSYSAYLEGDEEDEDEDE